ncbi:MAG: coproporphyrinogen dehydrogenase HemZ, partial [Clostridia bacterium]|nr:coproporphyrinogen dehydrogenase HemZ [Clostridia bacterium]
VNNLEEVYFVSPEKGRIMELCANRVITFQKKLSPKQISLYINIPFCPSRCKYCSFTLAYLKPYSMLIDDYFKALLMELTGVLSAIKNCGLELYSIYMGGGTPTVLTENQLQQLLQVIEGSSLSPKEFCVEAGRADTITEDKLRVLKAYGVDRISINPQSLNQKTLETIGRRHTVEEFYRAYEWSKKIGFETVNTDLIAGLTGESFSDFQYSLDEIVKLSPEHLTVHTLCKKRTSKLLEARDTENGEAVKQMLTYTYEKLNSLYEPYYIYRQKDATSSLENIGFMKNNKECAYNIFMMEEVSSVIAVGAGGTSKLVDFATKKPFAKLRTDKQPERYIRDIDSILREKIAFLEENHCNI